MTESTKQDKSVKAVDESLKGKRLLRTSEYEIDGTAYVVEEYIPEHMTDAQLNASVKKKIERLILNNME